MNETYRPMIEESTFSGLERMDFSKQQPRPKIRGSQFVKREQKIMPKLIIRNPFIPKEQSKPKPPRPA